MSRPVRSGRQCWASSGLSSLAASLPPPGATTSRSIARVRVVRLAEVLGGRADRDRVARAGRIRDVRVRLVAGGGHDDHALRVREPDRADDARDLARRDRRVELEAQVDDVRAVLGGPPDPARDRVRAALAVLVQHPDRHDLGVVGEPGHADAVVHVLGDRAGDVRAVAEEVEGAPVVVDEVAPGHERGAAEVRAHAGSAWCSCTRRRCRRPPRRHRGRPAHPARLRGPTPPGR